MNQAGSSDIMTVSGRLFDFLKPQPEQIDIEDIAHALSMTCRFSGHCKRFYSVAEHCYWVSFLVQKENALWGLLHDSSEAYLTDVPRPMKRFMPEYKDIEKSVQKFIIECFGLSMPEPEDVKEADSIMLTTEARDLFDEGMWKTWGLEHKPLEDFHVDGYSPDVAKYFYLERYHELSKM